MLVLGASKEMSRILFAWEFGANLGHTRAAAEVLSSQRFEFIQSPIHIGAARLAEPPANYAELLAAEAWCDRVALRGRLKAWLNVMVMGRFDAVIADNASGTLVAAQSIGELVSTR